MAGERLRETFFQASFINRLFIADNFSRPANPPSTRKTLFCQQCTWKDSHHLPLCSTYSSHYTLFRLMKLSFLLIHSTEIDFICRRAKMCSRSTQNLLQAQSLSKLHFGEGEGKFVISKNLCQCDTFFIFSWKHFLALFEWKKDLKTQRLTHTGRSRKIV